MSPPLEPAMERLRGFYRERRRVALLWRGDPASAAALALAGHAFFQRRPWPLMVPAGQEPPPWAGAEIIAAGPDGLAAPCRNAGLQILLVAGLEPGFPPIPGVELVDPLDGWSAEAVAGLAAERPPPGPAAAGGDLATDLLVLDRLRKLGYL
jgi:hypothetical protein